MQVHDRAVALVSASRMESHHRSRLARGGKTLHCAVVRELGVKALW